MAEWKYAGPGPEEDPHGEAVHPGDVRQFSEEPGWGAWVPAGDPEADAPPKGHLAETPPELAAQGILARGVTAADDKPEGM